MSILNLFFDTGNFIPLNITVVQSLGLHETIILIYLISQQNYLKKEKKLNRDGFFYSTHETIEDKFKLSFHHQRIAIKNLIEMNLIEMKFKGMPRKAYFKINEKNIEEYILKYVENNEKEEDEVITEACHQSLKIQRQAVKNLTTCRSFFDLNNIKYIILNIILNKPNLDVSRPSFVNLSFYEMDDKKEFLEKIGCFSKDINSVLIETLKELPVELDQNYKLYQIFDFYKEYFKDLYQSRFYENKIELIYLYILVHMFNNLKEFISFLEETIKINEYQNYIFKPSNIILSLKQQS
jgi:hypothetical protein